jgi:hypothetical protein
VFGTDGDGVSDLSEPNVTVDMHIALALELPRAKIAGNYVNVLPDGVTFVPVDRIRQRLLAVVVDHHRGVFKNLPRHLDPERDQQARQILEAELAKAIAAQADIARLWNNGEPVKQGDEFKNPAKYQQRLAELRMGLLRAEADSAGLRRELARLGTVVAKP